jgi:hypothetical protein
VGAAVTALRPVSYYQPDQHVAEQVDLGSLDARGREVGLRIVRSTGRLLPHDAPPRRGSSLCVAVLCGRPPVVQSLVVPEGWTVDPEAPDSPAWAVAFVPTASGLMLGQLRPPIVCLSEAAREAVVLARVERAKSNAERAADFRRRLETL